MKDITNEDLIYSKVEQIKNVVKEMKYISENLISEKTENKKGVMSNLDDLCNAIILFANELKQLSEKAK